MTHFRRDFAGLDIPWLEREFQGWVAGGLTLSDAGEV
jgi:hypothetical protein